MQGSRRRRAWSWTILISSLKVLTKSKLNPVERTDRGCFQLYMWNLCRSNTVETIFFLLWVWDGCSRLSELCNTPAKGWDPPQIALIPVSNYCSRQSFLPHPVQYKKKTPEEIQKLSAECLGSCFRMYRQLLRWGAVCQFPLWSSRGRLHVSK